MKKMLYFAVSAPDGTASTEQVACFPADQLSHFEMSTATQMRVYFNSNQEQDLSSVDSAHAALTITTGKHKEVMAALTQIINGGPHSDGFVVVADSENSVFAHANITACASIAVVDAS
jgi:hypothetical protein